MTLTLYINNKIIMLWTIKPAENQNFVCVHLFSWDNILANGTVDEMLLYIEKAKTFLKISWIIVNVKEIKFVEPYIPDDIEMFIASQTDPGIKDALERIITVRDAQGKTTNWPQHLRQIYLDNK